MHKEVKREIGIVLVIVVCGCTDETNNVKGPIPAGQYVVSEGDDLSNISLRAYGDMNLWHSLLNANPEIGKRPNFWVNVGDTLIIPPREKLDTSLPKSVFPKELPADYVVMPGDSLHFIAKNVYGDRELWPVIYEANRDQLSEKVKEDTRRLIAGQVLHIPAKEEAPRERE